MSTLEIAKESQKTIPADPSQTDKNIGRNRGAGVILLVLGFALLWIYGWASQIRYSPNTVNTTSMIFNSDNPGGFYFLFGSIFTVLGFGLIFTFFRIGTASGLFLSLFIVSSAVLFSPIFAKFWFNVFTNGFTGTLSSSTLLSASMGNSWIYVEFYNLKFALLMAISQLVLFTGVIGRLSNLQIVISSILYNFLWNLNFWLLIQLQLSAPDSRIFDDYQISMVYLFAACFGIVFSCLIKNPPAHDKDFVSSSRSEVLAHLGTFFVFLSFCTTTAFHSLKSNATSDNRTIVWEEAFIGTFLALSASVITTYAVSILLGGKIGLRQSLLGTISGAVMYGPIAGTVINTGAPIAVGVLAGFFSCIYFKVIFKKINQNRIHDSLGLFSFIFVAFIGTFLIAPIALKTYYNYNITLVTINGTLTSADSSGWILIYVGISVGIGLAGGLVVGGLVRFFESLSQKEFVDEALFQAVEYGLRQRMPYENVPVSQQLSAVNFNN